MNHFLFTTLKNHRPVHINDPPKTTAPPRQPQTSQRQVHVTFNSVQHVPVPVPRQASVSAPITGYNQILSRNIRDSQPTFSVSAMFGLKQGSCRSCGH